MSNDNFKTLFSLVRPDRIRSASGGIQDIYIETESDKGRIINSASFRRLQQKAQVFPLDPNASIRTRLTHSIEVSQIGRFIGQKVVERCGVGRSYSYSELAAFVNTIENACLLHDIGNPPYGHFGESAIREWFGERFREHPREACDLTEYDGNPQGFRLVTHLAGEDEFGLNLTCSLLLSVIKYPTTKDTKGSAKKIGIFDAELEVYRKACELTGWQHERSRFPLVYLMDAADDISYSMSDLEDGIEKGIIGLEDIKRELGPDLFKATRSLNPFVYFKTKVTRMAVEYAADEFSKALPRLLDGDKVELISGSSEIGDLLAKINAYARAKVYASESAERVELAGRSVIRGLLSSMSPLLDLTETDFTKLVKGERVGGLDLHERLLRRLPRSYIKKYTLLRERPEIERRAHLLVDFVSGMTDHFALQLYQVFSGIRIQ